MAEVFRNVANTLALSIDAPSGDWTIGQRIDVPLNLTALPEGRHDSLVISVTLPTGLSYLSSEPSSSKSGLVWSGTDGPSAGDTGTLTWDLETVTNPGNNIDPSTVSIPLALRLTDELPMLDNQQPP